MTKPLVSVIIPTYKREELLKRALRSVQNQTYKNIEVIIVDDSPEPKKCDFFKEFSDMKIIHDHSIIKRGSQLSRNTGIKISTGNFIAFLDDDDTWHPEKIEKQVNAMSSRPWASLCITYSHDLRFGQDRINKPNGIVSHNELLKSFNLSSTSSYFVPRIFLSRLKADDGYYFDESLKSGQEYDLAIRLTRHNMFVSTVEEILITQYSTENAVSENWGNKIRGIMRLYSKYHSEYSIVDHVKTAGILGLFFFGFIFSNRIYKLIIPIKEIYENV